MIRWIKLKLAKFLLNRAGNRLVVGKIDKDTAEKWNHLQAQVVSKGSIKWRWDKVLGGKK